MRTYHAIALLSGLITVSLGCGVEMGDTDTTGAARPSTPKEHSTKHHAVTGTARDTWLTDTGTVKDVPEASLTINALVPTGSGGFDTIAGTYDAGTGEFTIPDVPDGPYYLQYAPKQFLLTSERSFDLGWIYAGRPDAAQITQSPTNLVLDASNLTAWQDSDELEIFSLGANSGNEFEYLADTPPTAGDTSLTGFTVDLSLLPFPGLIEASQGDKTLFTHLTTRTSGGLTYAALGQAMTPGPINMTDGQPMTVSGAFHDVPQRSISATWDRSAFDALLASAGPNVESVGQSISLYTEPNGQVETSIGTFGDLLYLYDTGTTDVSLDLSYGDPYPKSHGAIGIVQVGYRNTLAAVSGPFKHVSGWASIAAPAEVLLHHTLVPWLSPPTGVTIGGHAATTDVTGVGTSPVIAWSAPAIGSPTRYIVSIYSFGVNSRSLVAMLTTDGTSVTVPPGLLQAGVLYAARINADTLTVSLTKPNHSKTTGAVASALTATFTP